MWVFSSLLDFFLEYGYMAVFGVLILCGFGLPVPEDITLVAGGVISAFGKANVHLMFLVGMAGVMIGDSVVFLAGSYKGKEIREWSLVKKYLNEERFAMVQEKFSKHGKWVVFMARFMPGLRTPIFFTAGFSKKVSFIRFFLTDFLAAIISVPVWVYLGHFLANSFDELFRWVHRGQFVILIALGVAIFVIGIVYYRKRMQVTIE
jgi:membrane protein DedA with SNARE-associated domain